MCNYENIFLDLTVQLFELPFQKARMLNVITIITFFAAKTVNHSALAFTSSSGMECIRI